MDTNGSTNGTLIQCQECGKIYQIPDEIAIDKLYIYANCPHCGIAKGLNLGNNEDDVYDLYDVTWDMRYY